jgi:hypothetical protein
MEKRVRASWASLHWIPLIAVSLRAGKVEAGSFGEGGIFGRERTNREGNTGSCVLGIATLDLFDCCEFEE